MTAAAHEAITALCEAVEAIREHRYTRAAELIQRAVAFYTDVWESTDKAAILRMSQLIQAVEYAMDECEFVHGEWRRDPNAAEEYDYCDEHWPDYVPDRVYR